MFETSATALCGTTGKWLYILQTNVGFQTRGLRLWCKSSFLATLLKFVVPTRFVWDSALLTSQCCIVLLWTRCAKIYSAIHRASDDLLQDHLNHHIKECPESVLRHFLKLTAAVLGVIPWIPAAASWHVRIDFLEEQTCETWGFGFNSFWIYTKALPDRILSSGQRSTILRVKPGLQVRIFYLFKMSSKMLISHTYIYTKSLIFRDYKLWKYISKSTWF